MIILKKLIGPLSLLIPLLLTHSMISFTAEGDPPAGTAPPISTSSNTTPPAPTATPLTLKSNIIALNNTASTNNTATHSPTSPPVTSTGGTKDISTGDTTPSTSPDVLSSTKPTAELYRPLSDPAIPGAVFALTNNASGNAIVVMRRTSEGTLKYSATIATGGKGPGPLPNSSSLSKKEFALTTFKPPIVVLTTPVNYNVLGSSTPMLLIKKDPKDDKTSSLLTKRQYDLYVLNAGSNTITHLKVIDTLSNSIKDLAVIKQGDTNSEGRYPTSLVMSQRIWRPKHRAPYKVLYVLHAANATITAFSVTDNGTIIGPIGGAVSLINKKSKNSYRYGRLSYTLPIPNIFSGPAQLALSADDTQLVVTIRGTSGLRNIGAALVVFNLSATGQLRLDQRTIYTPAQMLLSKRIADKRFIKKIRGPSDITMVDTDEDGTVFIINFAHSGYSASARLTKNDFYISGTPRPVVPLDSFKPTTNIWTTTAHKVVPNLLKYYRRNKLSTPVRFNIAGTHMMRYRG